MFAWWVVVGKIVCEFVLGGWVLGRLYVGLCLVGGCWEDDWVFAWWMSVGKIGMWVFVWWVGVRKMGMWVIAWWVSVGKMIGRLLGGWLLGR